MSIRDVRSEKNNILAELKYYDRLRQCGTTELNDLHCSNGEYPTLIFNPTSFNILLKKKISFALLSEWVGKKLW